MTTSADSEPDVWSLMRDAPGTLAARGAFSARWVLEPRRGMLRPSAAPLCELGECCERNCSLRRDAPAAREARAALVRCALASCRRPHGAALVHCCSARDAHQDLELLRGSPMRFRHDPVVDLMFERPSPATAAHCNNSPSGSVRPYVSFFGSLRAAMQQAVLGRSNRGLKSSCSAMPTRSPRPRRAQQPSNAWPRAGSC